MKERRLVPRVKCACPAEVRSGPGGRDVTLSYAVELSIGGCFVRTNRSMPVGSPVELTLSLESGGHVDVQGVVLYDGPASVTSSEPGAHGFAVGFVVIDRNSAARLRDYLVARGAGPKKKPEPTRERKASTARPPKRRRTTGH